MKTKTIFRWVLLILMGLFVMSQSINAQKTKLSRQEKKEIRNAQLNRNYFILDSLLNVRCFVLEADFLRDKWGNRVPVTSTLNFIKINSNEGVLQTGTDLSRGSNGVGGVTASGNIGSWNVTGNPKKLYYNISFYMDTNIGHYDVSMMVDADNHATATITGLGPGKLTWEGHLETLNNSRVFKGQDTI
jgi:hypothetical protein